MQTCFTEYYTADILSVSDYRSFGMQMPGSTYNSDSYRFGYQGSEMDNEVSGTGNTYTTHYRGLDPRIGRWFSVDPVMQAYQSPYNSMDDNPIWFNDPKGDVVPVHGTKKDIKTYLKQVGRASGNKFKVDNNGHLQLRRGKFNTKTTRRKSGDLSKLMENSINSVNELETVVVRDDDFTNFDGYPNAKYDIADFKKVKSRAMKAGLIAHIYNERLITPDYKIKSNRTGTRYLQVHESAKVFESRVISKMLGIPNVKRTNSFNFRNVLKWDGTIKKSIGTMKFIYGKTEFSVKTGVRWTPLGNQPFGFKSKFKKVK